MIIFDLMNALVLHIEYLLTKHDCVVVPGFGGFVLRHQEAVFISTHLIQPPCKIACFNPSLNHNDGLLANSLMAEKRIIFSEAMILIEAEVKKINDELAQGESVGFGSLGSFVLEEDTLQFTPADQNSFDLAMFGFAPLSLKPLPVEMARDYDPEPLRKNPDVILVPVNLKFLRHVSIVAVLIFGFLMIAQPLEHGSISSNYASMISSDLLVKAIVPDMTGAHEFSNEMMEVDDEITSPAEVSIETAPITLPTPEIKPETVAERPIGPVKRYYIIVGSCPTEDSAGDFIRKMNKTDYPSAGVLHKDNKYRIYVTSFTDKAEANKYLDVFRMEHKKYEQAWLLAHKQ